MRLRPGCDPASQEPLPESAYSCVPASACSCVPASVCACAARGVHVPVQRASAEVQRSIRHEQRRQVLNAPSPGPRATPNARHVHAHLRTPTPGGGRGGRCGHLWHETSGIVPLAAGAVVSDMTPNYLCSPKALRNIVQSLGTPGHFRLLLLLRVRHARVALGVHSPSPSSASAVKIM